MVGTYQMRGPGMPISVQFSPVSPVRIGNFGPWWIYDFEAPSRRPFLKMRGPGMPISVQFIPLSGSVLVNLELGEFNAS